MAISFNANANAILITGPTASGKSALAIKAAKAVGGVVINADSMQVYDTLRILTARPALGDMQGIPHYLYGHIPACESYSTGAWLRQAEALVEKLKEDGRKPVFVGGTGLYFKALTQGLAEMPDIPGEVRSFWRGRLTDEGAENLHRELALRDAIMAERLDPADGQRIVRALEVFETSGRSIADFQAEMAPPLVPADMADKIVVLPERPVLHERINARFEMMLESGAVEEVEALMALGVDPERPVMRAIGVPEIASWLRGEISRDDVMARASAATRQYAKRQMTWFRNQMGPEWRRFDPAAV